MRKVKQVILLLITLVMSMAGETAYASVSEAIASEKESAEKYEVCVQRPEDTASRTLNHLLSHRSAGVPQPCVQAGQPVLFCGFRLSALGGLLFGAFPAGCFLHGAGGSVRTARCTRRSAAGYLYLIERIQV